jgi:hypothetical protein
MTKTGTRFSKDFKSKDRITSASNVMQSILNGLVLLLAYFYAWTVLASIDPSDPMCLLLGHLDWIDGLKIK